MNGPEHYAEAERLLNNSQRELETATPNTVTEVLQTTTLAVAKAQAHATLALAAATATPYAAAPDGDTVAAWSRAVAVTRTAS